MKSALGVEHGAVVVADDTPGIHNRYILVEQPVSQDMAGAIEASTGAVLCDTECGWAKFVLRQTVHTSTQEVYEQLQVAATQCGDAVRPELELPDNPTREDFRILMARRAMRYD